MALLQHNWHEATSQAGHRRWSKATFHSGLIGIPGAIVGPQPEPVASRFDSKPGGLDIYSFAAMFEGGEEARSNAIAAIAEYANGSSSHKSKRGC